MTKTEEKIAKYVENAKELGLELSEELIEKVTKGLGPSIHNKDAETVSCSDKSELERVKTNFLEKKLGLSGDDLMEAVEEVCQKMGSSNRNKYRALFYALLVKKFSKESVYA